LLIFRLALACRDTGAPHYGSSFEGPLAFLDRLFYRFFYMTEFFPCC